MTGKHGPVVLIIKGLPDTATRAELKTLCKRTTGCGWRTALPGKGNIGCCDILRITDRENGQVEYHGVVEIHPANLGLKAMKELDGTFYQGRRLEVRRYRQRSSLLQQDINTEAAAHNRRRDHLSVDLVQDHRMHLMPTLSRLFSSQGSRGSYSRT